MLLYHIADLCTSVAKEHSKGIELDYTESFKWYSLLLPCQHRAALYALGVHYLSMVVALSRMMKKPSRCILCQQNLATRWWTVQVSNVVIKMEKELKKMLKKQCIGASWLLIRDM